MQEEEKKPNTLVGKFEFQTWKNLYGFDQKKSFLFEHGRTCRYVDWAPYNPKCIIVY